MANQGRPSKPPVPADLPLGDMPTVEGSLHLPSAPTGEYSAEHMLLFDFGAWLANNTDDLEEKIERLDAAGALPAEDDREAVSHMLVDWFLEARKG